MHMNICIFLYEYLCIPIMTVTKLVILGLSLGSGQHLGSTLNDPDVKS